MGNVTKKEIIDWIAQETGITQVDTKLVLSKFFESVAVSLEQGRNIEIRGFGRFKLRPKKARVARNPRTGESVHVEAGVKPMFELSKELKKRLNEYYQKNPS
jgi:DNA-binding protein HU-beta/integration host factor subunit beta